MGKVNLITKKEADSIAAEYLKNTKVQSLYVTRDGQVFLHDKHSYLILHERSHKLEPSWFYTKEDSAIKEENEALNVNLSLKALKERFFKLTEDGKIEKSEWENLKFNDLRKKYKELTT